MFNGLNIISTQNKIYGLSNTSYIMCPNWQFPRYLRPITPLHKLGYIQQTEFPPPAPGALVFTNLTPGDETSPFKQEAGVC